MCKSHTIRGRLPILYDRSNIKLVLCRARSDLQDVLEKMALSAIR